MPTVIDSFSGEYRFLSNFFVTPEPVMFEGVGYPTSEHAYVAAKVLPGAVHHEENGKPVLWRDVILFANTSGQVKRIGSKKGVNGFVLPLRPDWDTIRIPTMATILRDKFKPGSKMAEKLLATGDSTLIEGNHWGDEFWGVCKGKGENNLGKLLMEIRASLAGDT